MPWNLLVTLDSQRQELAQFESREDAEAALDRLMNAMSSGEGVTSVRGSRNTIMIDTHHVSTASVYESA